MGELEPSSPRKERKWRNHVAGLSVVSEASAVKESSQFVSSTAISKVFRSNNSLNSQS